MVGIDTNDTNTTRDAYRIDTKCATPLRLSGADLTRLREWAVAGHPYEVCGLLLGTAAEGAVHVQDVSTARNLETDRRNDRFVLDPRDWIAAEQRADARGIAIVGVWHTHPDHPAKPSVTDLASAWPKLSYLILSVRADRVADITSWQLDGDVFIEQPIEESAS